VLIGDVVTEISKEREVKALLKAKRTEIRLKYSLLADEEIAQELPALEKKLLAELEAGHRVGLSIGVSDAEAAS
jgi:hypothetical protein